MKTILLYGALGKKFGKKHSLDVKNPAEAIRALSVILKGFKRYMINDKDSGYKIFVGTDNIYATDMHNPTSDKEVIRIVPIITGYAKGDNPLYTMIGLILVLLAYAYGGPAAGNAMSSGWAIVAQVGISLMITGISGMLAEAGEEDNEDSDSKPNYAFDGAVNTTRQGNPVPVGYGTLRVGSQVISAGFSTDDY
jgi:predicted phage tail protein